MAYNILIDTSIFLLLVLQAHPANCICIEFDPTGKYFAVGSADALVSLWDVNELGIIHILRKLFYINQNIFTNFLSIFFSSLCIKIFQTQPENFVKM